MILEARNISKSIKKHIILDNVSIKAESGVVYGLRGENGSGKTMLLRALSGLMKIDEGEITLDGKVLGKDFSVLPSLGIVLENAGLFPGLTGYRNLEYLADIKKIAGREEIKDAIRRVGLDPEDKRVYGKYSLGMKQRLAIAQAIMERPDIIMLDEPTNSLDSEGVEEIRNIILEEKSRGAIIILTSHIRQDMDYLADVKYTVKAGKVEKE